MFASIIRISSPLIFFLLSLLLFFFSYYVMYIYFLFYTYLCTVKSCIGQPLVAIYVFQQSP